MHDDDDDDDGEIILYGGGGGRSVVCGFACCVCMKICGAFVCCLL